MVGFLVPKAIQIIKTESGLKTLAKTQSIHFGKDLQLSKKMPVPIKTQNQYECSNRKYQDYARLKSGRERLRYGNGNRVVYCSRPRILDPSRCCFLFPPSTIPPHSVLFPARLFSVRLSAQLLPSANSFSHSIYHSSQCRKLRSRFIFPDFRF